MLKKILWISLRFIQSFLFSCITISASEADPTVTASVKDGVDWSEVAEIPAEFADNKDDGTKVYETDGITLKGTFLGYVPTADSDFSSGICSQPFLVLLSDGRVYTVKAYPNGYRLTTKELFFTTSNCAGSLPYIAGVNANEYHKGGNGNVYRTQSPSSRWTLQSVLKTDGTCFDRGDSPSESDGFSTSAYTPFCGRGDCKIR